MPSVGSSVVLLVLAMVAAGRGRLEVRDFTGPDCEPPATWTWMDNAQHLNPCRTAAYLQGACHGATYVVKPLPKGQKYTPGDSSTANACYCSWATYNLLSACSLCQGEQNGILPWAQWNSTDCAKYTSTTSPWPVDRNDSIPNDVTFPNWAAKDPRTWIDGRWNPPQATEVASTEFGDYPLATSTPSSTSKPGGGTNAGAIAGGVVGGIVAIAVGIAIAVFLLCRAKRRKAELEKNRDPDITQHPVEYRHAPSPSDGSARFYGSSSGYTPLGHVSSPSNGSTYPMSPSTFVTHDQRSITQDSLLHSIPMTPPPVMQGPPSVFAAPQLQGSVSPFIAQQPSASAATHSKKLSEASQGGLSDISVRPAFNPPAYTATVDGRGDFSSEHPDQVSTVGSSSFVTTPSSSAQQTRHEKSSSATSIGSSGTHLTPPSNVGYWNHPGSTSFSGAADLLNTDDLPTPTPSYTAPPPGTMMSVTRSEKSRPPASAADTTQTGGTNADG